MEDQERIIKVDIEQEMRKSYIDYSMSVIVAMAVSLCNSSHCAL